jgi:alginate O-acetyltransferase complex protein AlgI
VYIPLGGSRRGRVRLHLLAVMVLSGLWHGFEGRFLLWGAAHGLLLIWERFRDRGLGRMGTVLAVWLLWIPFRAESLQAAWVILLRMATFAPGVRYYPAYTLVYGGLVLLSHLLWREVFRKPLDLRRFSGKVVFCTFLLMILLLACAGETAFLYAGF